MSAWNDSVTQIEPPSRRQIISTLAVTAGALTLGSTFIRGDEISHAAESIHQETILKTNRKRVYEALTSPRGNTTRDMVDR
jgi:hypothetical protein